MLEIEEIDYLERKGRIMFWEKRLRPLFLWLVLIAAFFLRTHANRYGLPAPDLLGLEEDRIVERGMAIWLGIRPLMHWPGSTHMILFAIVGGLYFVIIHFQEILFSLAGNLFDVIRLIDNLYIELFRDPTNYYLLARNLQAVLDACGIYVTYRIGVEAGDDAGGLLGAALWALSSIGVRMGHLANVDGLMVTLMLMSLLMAMRFRNNGRVGDLLFGSALAGLATGAKFSGVFCLVPLTLAVLIRWREGRRAASPEDRRSASAWRHIFMLIGIFTLGLIVGCPYVITNLPVMGKALFNSGVRMFIGGASGGWRTMALVQLPQAIGVAPAIIGILGLAFFLIKRQKGIVLITALVAAYYAVFGRSGQNYFRYVMPLGPLFCLAAGIVISRFLRFFFDARTGKWTKAVAASLAAAVIAVQAFNAVKAARIFEQEDTRIVAWHWIEKNVKADSRILVTGYGNPPLRPNRASLIRTLKYYESPDLLQKQYDIYIELLNQVGVKNSVKSRLPEGEYPFIALTESLAADKAFDRTKARYMLSDPHPPAPAYDLVIMYTGAAFTESGYMKEVKDRLFDVVIIHRNEAKAGPYGELRDVLKRLASRIVTFEPEPGKRMGPPIELYFIPRQAQAASQP